MTGRYGVDELSKFLLGSTVAMMLVNLFLRISLLNMLVSHIVSGDTIELRGFGTFLPALRKQRPAHNPKTGEAVEDIPRRYVPTLKFSPSIRRAMPRLINGK